MTHFIWSLSERERGMSLSTYLMIPNPIEWWKPWRTISHQVKGTLQVRFCLTYLVKMGLFRFNLVASNLKSPTHIYLPKQRVRESWSLLQVKGTLQIDWDHVCISKDCVLNRAFGISGNMGLVSAGRIDKDTPPLTTPSHASKSSTMDISPHDILNWNPSRTSQILPSERQPRPLMIHGTMAYLYSRQYAWGSIVTFWRGFWLRGVQPLSNRW